MFLEDDPEEEEERGEEEEEEIEEREEKEEKEEMEEFVEAPKIESKAQYFDFQLDQISNNVELRKKELDDSDVGSLFEEDLRNKQKQQHNINFHDNA